MINLSGLLFALFFLPAAIAIFFLAEEVKSWGDDGDKKEDK